MLEVSEKMGVFDPSLLKLKNELIVEKWKILISSVRNILMQ